MVAIGDSVLEVALENAADTAECTVGLSVHLCQMLLKALQAFLVDIGVGIIDTAGDFSKVQGFSYRNIAVPATDIAVSMSVGIAGLIE